MDMIYLLLSVAFFTLSAVLPRACDRLKAQS